MLEFICTSCQSRYDLNHARWRCDCGGMLTMPAQSTFDPGRIDTTRAGLWRYHHVLPIQHSDNIISFGEGMTPLQRASLDGYNIQFKSDHLFPSGSFKDRGASVLISKLKEWGVQHIVEDSSGNAGASMASYCAAAGIQCDIYVPASTSPDKLTQIQAAGATLHKIKGSRQDTADAVWDAAATSFYASHVWHPLFFQGTKTIAFEICEQLNWQAPDVLVMPVGNGSLLLGAFLGFRELQLAGIIENLPRFVGVQAQHCSPLARAFQHPEQPGITSDVNVTLAEGIAIEKPTRGKQIINAVRQTHGTILAVLESDIRSAMHEMLSRGYYLEPTAVVSVAGTRHVLTNNRDQRIVTILTGHGLKAGTKIATLL